MMTPDRLMEWPASRLRIEARHHGLRPGRRGCGLYRLRQQQPADRRADFSELFRPYPPSSADAVRSTSIATIGRAKPTGPRIFATPSRRPLGYLRMLLAALLRLRRQLNLEDLGGRYRPASGYARISNRRGRDTTPLRSPFAFHRLGECKTRLRLMRRSGFGPTG
jgi:hypothetical protein